MKKKLLLTSAGIGAGFAIAGMGQALAQTAGSNPEAAAVEEILVTGSRILRKDHSSASPVVTVGVEQVQETGAVTVEQYLNTMPQFTEGATSGTLSIGGGVGATLNMRALGSTRNLVLLDQRRLPVANQFGVVDTNIVPKVMLRGVEVLTGGASSVYGSEAISGVANFLSKDYFEGVHFNIEYGDTTDGVADFTDISAAAGAENKDGRRRAVLALSYTDRSALRGEDRDFFRFAIPSSFIGQGIYRSGVNAPDAAAVNALFASYGIAGTPSTDRLGFNDDGTLFTQFGGALNYQGPTDEDSLFAPTNDGTEVRQPVGRQGTALKALERYGAFAKIEYDFSDAVTAYGQFLYSDSETSGSASLNITLFGPPALVPVTNPFIPDDLAGLLATRPDPTAPFILEQRFMGIGERIHNEGLTTSQFIVGVKGSLGIEDWTYRPVRAERRHGCGRDDRKPVAGVAPESAAAGPGWRHLAVRRWIQPVRIGQLDGDIGGLPAVHGAGRCLHARLSTVTCTKARLPGRCFRYRAATCKASLGAVYRKDSVNYIPSISIVTNDALGLNPSNPSSGETETYEFGGEVLVPLFSEHMNLTAGYRYSDQDVSGSGNSWNVGLEWRPMDKLLRERQLPAGNPRAEHRRAVQRLPGQRVHGRRPDEQPEQRRSLRHQDGASHWAERRRGCRYLRRPGTPGGPRRYVPTYDDGAAGIDRRQPGPGAGNRRHDHLRDRMATRVREQRPRDHGRLLGHLNRRRHQDDRRPVGSSAVLQYRLQPDARSGQRVLPVDLEAGRNRHD